MSALESSSRKPPRRPSAPEEPLTVKPYPLNADQWRGWHCDAFPQGSWQVAGDELQAIAGAPRIDLISRQRYRDFVFRFEFSLPQRGNSGVFYRVDEAAELAWHSGPEMQLLDDAHHPDGRQPTTRNGALYALRAAEPATQIEHGRFISGAVSLRGQHVEHWLAGRRVLACALDDPGLREAMRGGKFAGFAGFAQASEGHLVLQHHGEAVRFRRLSIEPVD
ncbi:DUF1080 domain-containing protein [Pseudomonas balearica]|nr:DUF1080 domain-containing protein [Stutzerimonas balearica]MBK3824967.1 DUF1080 domain-containing protein [Stutzerimonas balearica]MBK3854658.1 DUF1080 domain-containing protein [Stutzerimonas balearica]